MESKRYEEDFKIIRTAIDSAKNPIDKLGQFFKNYAMINIIIVALNLIVNLYQGLAMEIYIVKMICFDYQAILYIYGIVVVVIPVILWIARITRLVISNNEGHQVSKMLEMLVNLQVFSAIVLLSVSFLVVSFVCSNKVCAICALANLAVYLIVLAIDKELSIGNIIIHYQDLYYYIVLVLGYMVMAKCIRKE